MVHKRDSISGIVPLHGAAGQSYSRHTTVPECEMDYPGTPENKTRQGKAAAYAIEAKGKTAKKPQCEPVAHLD